MVPPRPIQPKAPAENVSLPGPEALLGSSLSPRGSVGDLPAKKGGRSSSRSSIACVACKRRKIKCTGPPPPCAPCKSSGNECIIDETLDNRRKVAVKRAAEVANVQRILLQRLLDALRTDNQAELELLLSRLRGPASVTSVAELVEQIHLRYVREGYQDPYPLDDLIQGYMNVLGGSAEFETPDEPSTSQTQQHNAGVGHQLPGASYSMPTQAQAVALLDSYIPFIFEFHTKSNAVPVDEQLLRPSSVRLGKQPISGTEGLSSNIEYSRSSWHPALQINSADAEYTGVGTISATTGEAVEWLTTAGSSQYHVQRHIEIFSLQSVLDQRNDLAGFGANAPNHPTILQFPAHVVQPLCTNDSSPFSRAILEYRDAARKFIAEGGDVDDILGGPGVEVELFFRERRPDDPFTVSNWACDIWRDFHGWDIYVRLANILMLTTLMRWMIVPTPENYANVPNLLKPSVSQCFTPHHIGIDFLPIPPLREVLLTNLRDWLTALPNAKCSCNWPYSMDEAVQRHPTLGQLRLAERFEQHVAVEDNWSFSTYILEQFPELEGKVRLEPEMSWAERVE